jgi:hypothetical protein
MLRVVRDQTSVTKFIVGSRPFQFEAQVNKGIYHSFMFDDDRKVDTIGPTDLRSSGVFRNKVLSESSLRDRGFFSLTSLPVGGQTENSNSLLLSHRGIHKYDELVVV